MNASALRAGERHTKDQPMSKDTHLQLSVLAELEWEPRVTAAHIAVDVENLLAVV